MKILKDKLALFAWRKTLTGTVGFVPTMGNLHAGHFSLVKQALEHSRHVIVSIFVNPLQFGPREDFASYPRTPEEDCFALKELGVTAVYMPNETDMYPNGRTHHALIQVPALGGMLCGASRPGFFTGVATVVTKLFHQVQPDLAVFGEKDYQQLLVIQRLVQDLNFSIQILPGKTLREPDGLAMSSRNGYLSSTLRKKAPELYQQLLNVRIAINNGNRDYEALCEKASSYLAQTGWEPDYFVVRRAIDLETPSSLDDPLRILAAAKLGTTRLIDNISVFEKNL